MVAPDEETYVIGAIIQKFGRYLRAGTAPIDVVVAKQHPIGASVSADIGFVRTAVRKAVVRISLAPFFAIRIPRINIVSECLLLAASQVRFLDLETRIVPILLKCHRAGDSHDIYKMPFAAPPFRPGSDNPVADLCDPPDSRFARCESADSEERVRRESVISGHDV